MAIDVDQGDLVAKAMKVCFVQDLAIDKINSMYMSCRGKRSF